MRYVLAASALLVGLVLATLGASRSMAVTDAAVEPAATPGGSPVTGSLRLNCGLPNATRGVGEPFVIRADFAPVSSAGAVTELRLLAGVGHPCLPSGSDVTEAWRRFEPVMMFTTTTRSGFTRFSVSAQFRDELGNTSETVCNEVTVEGLPNPPTPTPPAGATPAPTRQPWSPKPCPLAIPHWPDRVSHIIRAPRQAPDVFSAPGASNVSLRRLAVRPDGSVLLLDEGGHRVLRFAADGLPLGQWGGLGREEGRLLAPTGLVAGPDGLVFVADTDEPSVAPNAVKRIQRFTAEGRRLGSWWPTDWSAQPHDGLLQAVGADGSVYVVDYRYPSRTLRRYLADGRLAEVIDGIGGEAFAGPLSAAVAPDGHVFVADSARYVVHELTANLRHLRSWRKPGDGPGEWGGMLMIAAGPDDNVYLAESFGRHAGVDRFDRSGRLLNRLDADSTSQESVMDLAVDPDGSVYLLRLFDRTVEHVAPDGRLLAVWGNPDTPPAESPFRDGDVGEDGTLVLRGGDGVVRLLTGPGKVAATIQPEQVGGWPVKAAAAPDGTVYVLQAEQGTTRRIVHLDRAAMSLGSWPVDGEGAQDLTVAPDGTLYYSDGGAARVVHFDADGTELQRWGTRGAADGEFADDVRIDVAADGAVVTLDSWQGGSVAQAQPAMTTTRRGHLNEGSPAQPPSPPRIQLFSADGRHQRTWMVDALAGPLFFNLWHTLDLALLPRQSAALGAYGYGISAERQTILFTALAGEPASGSAPTGRRVFDGPERLGWLAAAPDGTLYAEHTLGVLVRTPSAPASWYATYFPDASWSAWPSARAEDGPNLAVDWGDGPPAAGLPADGFVARFERVTASAGGLYRYDLHAEGGVRLWIGERLVIDRWEDAGVDEIVELFLGAGTVDVTLEYRDPAGSAAVALHRSLVTAAVSRVVFPLILQGGRY